MRSGAISRYPLYLFGKEAAKKDAASIGAKQVDFFIRFFMEKSQLFCNTYIFVI
jgi:hypothetical protein